MWCILFPQTHHMMKNPKIVFSKLVVKKPK